MVVSYPMDVHRGQQPQFRKMKGARKALQLTVYHQSCNDLSPVLRENSERAQCKEIVAQRVTGFEPERQKHQWSSMQGDSNSV